MRAPHLHFMVTAPGYRTLVTHIFVRCDELLDSDTVLGVRDSLVKDLVAQPLAHRHRTGGTYPVRNGRACGSTSCWRRVVHEIACNPSYSNRA